MQVSRAGRYLAAFQEDAVAFYALHVTQPHHPLHVAQGGDFEFVAGRAPHHGRCRRRIQTQHDASLRALFEKLLRRVALGGCFHLLRGALGYFSNELAALKVDAVEEPHVSGSDPCDPLGVDAFTEQPLAGVHGGFSSADDHIALRWLVS